MSPAVGDPAPPFALPDVSGGQVALDDLGEGPVVVAFWCNHCPYVRAWEERFVALAREYAPQGVAVVAINANDAEAYPADAPERMRERAQEAGYPFPYLHDAGQEVARAYGAGRTPEVFVLDAARRVAYRGAIDDAPYEPSEAREHHLRDALEAILAGAAPATAETPAVGCTIKWRR